jgi:uncharacterized damage-inducible protein DinB
LADLDLALFRGPIKSPTGLLRPGESGIMSHAALIADYLAGVDLLQSAVTGMTREQVLARPIAGKWSTLEVVAHVADFEPIFADRIKRILATERPWLVGAHEQPFADHLRYHDRDLETEVQLIAAVRRQLAAILSRSAPEAFQRCGVHTHDGLMTVEYILTYATRHIQHHVPFIIAKKEALAQRK